MVSELRVTMVLKYSKQVGQPDIKPIVRLVLSLSSVAMLVAAGLVFAGLLPMPVLIGYLFVAIALVDITIAYVVFGS